MWVCPGLVCPGLPYSERYAQSHSDLYGVFLLIELSEISSLFLEGFSAQGEECALTPSSPSFECSSNIRNVSHGLGAVEEQEDGWTAERTRRKKEEKKKGPLEQPDKHPGSWGCLIIAF